MNRKMVDVYENLEPIMPPGIQDMPLMQYAEIQIEVTRLLSDRVIATINKFPKKVLTKMLTGLKVKHETTSPHEEVVRIYKRGKLRTTMTFKHDKSMRYGVNTRTIVNRAPKP